MTTGYQSKLVWPNIIYFVLIHIFGFQGLYYCFTAAQWKTITYAYVLAVLSELGLTAGSHRLWTHRAYKAKLPLRMFLCILQTLGLQNSIYVWVRDHRVHHKYTDTDADPHNAKRGFFFSHMGWLLVKKHEDVAIKGKNVDMSDLQADPMVMFQHKFYQTLGTPISLLLPALLPWYCWGENLYTSWCITCALRYCCTLHVTWSVNSVAHIWGSKPYDKTIKPVENLSVAILSLGEGWHNYHHVFPWDYKTGELGNYGTNFTTAFIDLMATIGWAYDLKTASQTMIRSRINRTGEGGQEVGDGNANPTWGWEDPDLEEEDKEFIEMHHPKRA